MKKFSRKENERIVHTVYNYKTFDNHGFMNNEFDEFLKLFPKINRRKFDEELVTKRCTFVKIGNIEHEVHYHLDVTNAVITGLLHNLNTCLPIHETNDGVKSTKCNNCGATITESHCKQLYCRKCKI